MPLRQPIFKRTHLPRSVIGGAVAWLGAVFAASDERLRLMAFGNSGTTLRNGGILGVRTGDQWAQADQTLRSVFRPVYVMWDVGVCTGDKSLGAHSDSPVLKGRAEVTYRDRSWHNGVVSLCLQDVKVAAISFSYVRPFFMDM